MAYSTDAQFRANVSIATTANCSAVVVADRIGVADNEVETDLANIIDFTAIVTTPTFISLLAQYKTAELCLVYMYGKKRDVKENSDIVYWQDKYNKLLEKIIAGEIPLVDASGNSIAGGSQTFVNTAKDGIEPALGQDKWGGFDSKSDILEDRPVE